MNLYAGAVFYTCLAYNLEVRCHGEVRPGTDPRLRETWSTGPDINHTLKCVESYRGDLWHKFSTAFQACQALRAEFEFELRDSGSVVVNNSGP